MALVSARRELGARAVIDSAYNFATVCTIEMPWLPRPSGGGRPSGSVFHL